MTIKREYYFCTRNPDPFKINVPMSLFQLTLCSFRKSSKAKIVGALVCLGFYTVPVSAQSVTGIITDYNSFWKTATAAINPVNPDNSHNLLAFTFKGVQYSTGVNDALLANKGEVFTAGDFWSLPVAGLSAAPTSNTKVGLGEMYDGVHNGPSNPRPSNNLSDYLTDGIKGLNIGTCIANLPAGSISFNVSNILPEHIGDGIPDVLVTQVADPSASTDYYSFTTATGTLIGTKKAIAFNNISVVGNWIADFYEASTNPMNLTSSFTNTSRPIRLWAADLSEFGITAANYTSISRFVITLSGNSDVAFVAYNNKTFNLTNVLPVKLSLFSVKNKDEKALLQWQTESEQHADFFTIEKSNALNDFMPVGKVKAAGNSNDKRTYAFTDNHPQDGTNYYRLKITDKNGSITYSNTVAATFHKEKTTMQAYPNPSKGIFTVIHPALQKQQQLKIFSGTGIQVFDKKILPGTTSTAIQIDNLPKGIYYLQWQDGENKKTTSVSIQ